MRNVAVLVCALIVALVVSPVVALAMGDLSGSLTTQIGLDGLFGSVYVQTESVTPLAELAVSYKIDAFTFSSRTAYNIHGTLQQIFDARGSLGLLQIDSRLAFSPVFGGSGSTIDLTNSVNSPTQQFNLGRVYFVDRVEVTALTLDNNVTTTWRMQASLDGSNWEWVSEEITGTSTVPVVILVSGLARYVEIVVVAPSSGFVDESAISAEVSASSFITTVGVAIAGISLDTRLAIASGGSSLTLTVKPAEDGSLLDRVRIEFGMEPVTCVFGFESMDVGLDMSFGCVEELMVDIGFECDEGFTELELSARDIKTGFSWLEADLSITFSLTEKQVRFTPSLELDTAGMCFTPYIKLDTGAAAVQLEGLTFYGIRMSSSVDGVTFESLTYFDDIHHTKDNYWEMFSIAVDGDTCCGSRFYFKAATHFSKTSDSLFDWGETEFDLEFGLAESLLVNAYLSYTTAGVDDLILGFVVTW